MILKIEVNGKDRRDNKRQYFIQCDNCKIQKEKYNLEEVNIRKTSVNNLETLFSDETAVQMYEHREEKLNYLEIVYYTDHSFITGYQGAVLTDGKVFIIENGNYMDSIKCNLGDREVLNVKNENKKKKESKDKKDSGIYLEISGRQTGKTERMVEDIMTTLLFNRDIEVFIVCFNKKTYESIKNRIKLKFPKNMNDKEINETLNRVNYIFNETLNRVNYIFNETSRGHTKEYLKSNNCKFYFDEFDFIKAKINHPYSFIFEEVLKNAYYVTTPKYIRKSYDKNDFLWKLLDYTGGKYHQLRSPLVQEQSWRSEDSIKTELNGIFCENFKEIFDNRK